jgi:polyhydroxyalkanoate synthesis regulator protein
MQKRLQDQSRQLFGQNPLLTSDAWGEFVKMQGPAIQGLMSRYLEQSASAFMEMQQQLQNQSRNLFGAFPFPGFRGTTGTGEKPPGEPEKGGGGENKG